MNEDNPIKLRVVFYKLSSGTEPVREWLKVLPKVLRKIVGEDIKVVQTNWPIGMPLVRNLGKKLWEVRSSIPNGIARVLFIVKDHNLVLLHGFIKKSQKTPNQELELARKRQKDLEE